MHMAETLGPEAVSSGQIVTAHTALDSQSELLYRNNRSQHSADFFIQKAYGSIVRLIIFQEDAAASELLQRRVRPC